MPDARSDFQLTLDLFSSPRQEFDGFQSGDNFETVSALKHWASGVGSQTIYIWGASGTGKSHLLQAAVKAADLAGARAIYVPVCELLQVGTQILDGLHELDAIAFDDVDLCGGHKAWEKGLFGLYNALQTAGSRLLMAASQSPTAAPFELPDLCSRVQASLVYRLRELDEMEKAEVLRRAAEHRGIPLPEGVLDLVMQRERRDMVTLMQILEFIGGASLSRGRRLTVPFVREILASRDEPLV